MDHWWPLQFNLKDILKSLNRDDLDNFKCVLKNMSLPRTLKQIPQIILDMADGVHLAEILHEYCPSGWVETVTMEIFQMINREDLADLVMEQLKEHKHKKEWNKVFRNKWKFNFWPKCKENLYVETESYRTLVTLCNPKATMPFAHAIVLHGPPGSGKTTVANRLMLQWSESKQAQMFPCAFSISCREVNVTNSCTFAQLLSLKNDHWRDYVKSLDLAENFLFVVDGFDELRVPAGALLQDICSDWDTEKPAAVLLSSLLKRKMAPHATLLVTTQTQALRQIYLMIDQPFLIENQGFSEQDIQEYFKRFFKDEEGEEEDKDEEKALRALNALRCNAALFHMASIPAACMIFCLCLEKVMEKGEDLALTCQSHTSMFLNFLCRMFSPETYERHLKKEFQISFKKTCFLAADSLLEQLPTFSKEDILKLQPDMKGLHPFVCRYIINNDSYNNSCSFIYIRIQQLLAAIVFVQELEKSVSKYSMQNMLSKEARLKNPNLSGVLLFVFGLLNETRIQELATIFGCQISISVKRKFLECESGKNKPFLLLMDVQDILSCLYESQEEGLVKEAMALLEEISLHLKTNMDLMHASFCLKNSQNLRTMSLQVDKGIFPENDAVLESTAWHQGSQNDQCLLTFWTDFCDMFNSNEKLVFLDISESFFSSSSLQILCDKLSSSACHLQKVILKNISPADAYKKLCLTFYGYETLSHLTLKGDNLSTMLPSLSMVVKHPSCKLKFLSLSSCSTTIHKWNEFFSALKVSQSLTCLDLTDNELLNKGIWLLCKTWKQPNSILQRVSLENCHLTEACCKGLASVLMVSQTLTHLNLAKNTLGDNGVKILCESLSHPECKLQTLVLWSCDITSDGCCHLSKMLRQASSLEHLDLGLNYIRSVGARFLCEALKEPQSNLKSLWLYGCSMTPVNCKDFSKILRNNKSLNTLDLAQNSLGTDAVKTFCEDLKLRICPLQTLRLKFDDANPTIQKLIQNMKESHPQLTISSDQPDPRKKEPLPHFIF
ncbi:NACHT, LRR and PYD domains-containing protein 2 [Cricetulus griseus]|uniref:NACHT, LRR and PYD domains-containing protein 2 n=1 Tax=Cricetulus griseus TaxID=10029 RepID=A0A9J7HEM0_CRIGR|nr:NACHT, LRR and PYD domains-containing protein 2 [Cricetulus griseus]XP_035308968.1 NACHT, LRR and PYD domains-containing protein 2 [Cricetulus griseus]